MCGDGRIRKKGIGPSHVVTTGLAEVTGTFAHICLRDLQKQAALQIAKTGIHFIFDFHGFVVPFYIMLPVFSAV